MKKLLIVMLITLTVIVLSGCTNQQANSITTTIITSTTSATKIEPTSTISPTPSPLPTPAPTPVPLTAKQLAKALRDNGVPIKNIVSYTDKTDPNHLLGRPNQYSSKVNFSVTGHKDDPKNPDNTIEAFINSDDAMSRYKYVKAVSESMSILAQYVYVSDVYVFRLDHEILPSKAKKYEQIFRSLTSN